MRYYLKISVILWICTLSACTTFFQKPLKNDVPSLKRSVAHMVKVLDTDAQDIERHKEFIQTYAPPQELKNKLKAKDLDHITAIFIAEKKKPLLQALKYIASREPTTVKDGILYIYKLPEGVAPLREVRIRWDRPAQQFYMLNR